MNFKEYLLDARITIKSNKLRSSLSTLGIMIGVFSVVIMLGFSKGAEVEMLKQLGELAKNQITIYAGGYNYEQNKSVSPDTLNEKTVEYLADTFPELEGNIIYSIDSSSEITIKKVKEYVSIKGTSMNWLSIMQKKLTSGTFFSPSMYLKKDSVCIISYDLAQQIFGKKKAIGKKISLIKKYFTIIGVLEKDERFAYGKTYEAYIPLPTLQEKSTGEKKLNSIIISLDTSEDNRKREKRIQYALLKYYGHTNFSEAGFSTSSFATYLDQIKKTQNMMKYLLLAIGSISLLVGGIGVMNIMLVSVTERTREIGIRKALGALKKDIIFQFLVESIFISLMGGIAAIMLSYGVAFFINKWLQTMQLKVLIAPSVVITALVLTCGAGVLFGILPAKKAAKLRPIDALRFE